MNFSEGKRVNRCNPYTVEAVAGRAADLAGAGAAAVVAVRVAVAVAAAVRPVVRARGWVVAARAGDDPEWAVSAPVPPVVLQFHINWASPAPV